MMDYNELMKLPALRPNEVLDMLFEFSKHENEEGTFNMPEVTIITTYGITVSGHMLSFDKKEDCFVLGIIGEGKPSIRYLYLSSVQGVEVNPTEYWLHMLSKGNLPFTAKDEDVLNGLQLRAYLKEKTENIQSLFTTLELIELKLVNKEDRGSKYLGKALIDSLVIVLRKISEDTLAKEAFEDAFRKIELRVEDVKEFKKEGNTLILSIAEKEGPYGLLKVNVLIQEIEKLI